MKTRWWFRSVCVTVALLLALSASAAGLRYGGEALWHWLRFVSQGEPPDYTEAPDAVDPGPNPGRDEDTQDGVWNNDSKLVLGQLEADQAAASQVPYTTAPYNAPNNPDPMQPMYEDSRQLEVDVKRAHGPIVESVEVGQGGYGTIGGGPPLPWESAFPGGGSNSLTAMVNSNTGNRFTALPVFSMPARGGLTFGLTLYHNSRANFGGAFGPKWSTNFDARLKRDNPHGALSQGNVITVRWGNGQTVPFTYDPNKNPVGWYPPDGIYDRITMGGSTHSEVYTLETKHGIKYEFSHPNPGDSSMCGQGVLTKIRDRNNNSITITRELVSGRVLLVTDPIGRRISFGYDINSYFGRIREIKDPSNRQWLIEYNGNGPIWKVKSPVMDGVVYARIFGYDAHNNITSEVDHRGKAWTCEYDPYDRQTKWSEPGLFTPLPYNGYTFSYNTTRSAMTDPLQRVSKDYYSGGKIWSVMDEAGFYETFTWDSVRRVQSYRTKRGHTWTYTLDSKGNVLSETSPNGEHSYATYNADNTTASTSGDLSPSTIRYAYDGYGRLNRAYRDLNPAQQDLITCVNNAQTGQASSTATYAEVAGYGDTQIRTFNYTYDGYGNPQSVIDPRSKTSTVSANMLGWVTSAANQLGHTTQVSYDNWGRPTLISHPGGTATVQIQYDPEGNVTYVTDERTKTHSWTYNDRGLVTDYTNANQETEHYDYTYTGFLASVRNGRQQTRYYTATARDEVKSLTMPDGHAELWQYDKNGNVSTYWGAYQDPNERWTTYYGYDASDRPVSVNYPAGTPDVSFSYTNYGHTVTMQEDVQGRGPTTWTYDSWGNLGSFTSPDGAPLNYTYNRQGERLTMQDTTSGVGTSTYGYDSFGRLVSLTNWLNEVTSWHYDDAGRMDKRTLGNGTWEDIAYDTRSRPTSITLKKPGPVTLRAQSYTYDAASNVLSHTLAGVTTSYDYDNINQLKKEYRGTQPNPTWQIAYDYDANGNRIARNILGGAQEVYSVDAGDKLTSVTWSGGSKAFSYDSAGRRKTQTVGGATTTYNWDHESRLLSTTGAVATSYAYNGLDSRITKTDSGGTRNYRRDGAYVTDPVLGDNQANYTPGISESRSGTSRYLHSGLKNADSRTLADKSVEATRDYDAFGNLVSSSGTWSGPFGYAGGYGYQEDPESGLKVLGHRYYDSTTGRFLSRDPASTGRNWFAYCSRPLRSADPSGLDEQDLNANQKRIVQNLIDDIRRDGKTDAADVLQAMLNDGRIRYDSGKDSDGAFAVCNESLFGSPVIVLYDSFFAYWEGKSTPYPYGKRTTKAEIDHLNAEDFFEGWTRLKATLYHEQVHAQEAMYHKILAPKGKEKDAYDKQIAYLEAQQRKYKHGAWERKVIQKLIDHFRRMKKEATGEGG